MELLHKRNRGSRGVWIRPERIPGRLHKIPVHIQKLQLIYIQKNR